MAGNGTASCHRYEATPTGGRHHEFTPVDMIQYDLLSQVSEEENPITGHGSSWFFKNTKAALRPQAECNVLTAVNGLEFLVSIECMACSVPEE